MGSARGAVADDNEIRVQGFEITRGIFECFSFFERGSLSGKVDNISGEALLAKFEADSCAGRWLDEQIDDGLAAQSRNFLDRALADGFESARGIEDSNDLVGAERFDIQ